MLSPRPCRLTILLGTTSPNHVTVISCKLSLLGNGLNTVHDIANATDPRRADYHMSIRSDVKYCSSELQKTPRRGVQPSHWLAVSAALLVDNDSLQISLNVLLRSLNRASMANTSWYTTTLWMSNMHTRLSTFSSMAARSRDAPSDVIGLLDICRWNTGVLLWVHLIPAGVLKEGYLFIYAEYPSVVICSAEHGKIHVKSQHFTLFGGIANKHWDP